jgi:hypothetical protein
VKGEIGILVMWRSSQIQTSVECHEHVESSAKRVPQEGADFSKPKDPSQQKRIKDFLSQTWYSNERYIYASDCIDF